jgi:hypothetical protein
MSTHWFPKRTIGLLVDERLARDGAGWLHSGDMGLMRPDGHLRFMVQGHAVDRRRERRSAGGRGLPRQTPCDQCGGGGRRAGRAVD